ncbi:MAG TPA: hypothetical protein VI685_06830 [Candidatus Angelobacter sp.]
MSFLKRNLNLRVMEDRQELFDSLEANQIRLDPSVLDYALKHLSEEWFRLLILGACSLRTSQKGQYAVPLTVWLNVIQCLFEFRNHAGIAEQIRRLSIPSHERLDTVLVIVVAGRYHQRGVQVIFEPNGRKSTDLLIVKQAHRVYVEVKRENRLEHNRHQRTQAIANILTGRLDNDLRDSLVAADSRIEIRFSRRRCSDQYLEKVTREIKDKTGKMQQGEERELESLEGCRLAFLKRGAALFYEKGMHVAHVRVEKPGTPVPAFAPESALVRCSFEIEPSLEALGRRIRQAVKQLKRDLATDSTAQGAIIMEVPFAGPETVDAITKRFWPKQVERFLGITVIGNASCAIPRSGLDQEQVNLLKYAGINIDGSGHVSLPG